jgi:hypothetical protein
MTETTVNFGGFTRRQREAGAWLYPVVVKTPEGVEVGRITSTSESWDVPSLTCTGSVRVVSSTHTRGYGGGYVSLRIIIPTGATVETEETVSASPPPPPKKMSRLDAALQEEDERWEALKGFQSGS